MHFDSSALSKDFPLDIVHFQSIDSTSRYLKNEISMGNITKPTFCIADEQTAGYGQRERSWESDKSFSPLTCSFSFPIDYPLANLLQKSIPVALILRRLLSNNSKSFCQVKWPNDIYVNGLKAAGCLMEVVKPDKRTYLVFGLGINLSAPEDSVYGYINSLDIYPFLVQLANELSTLFMVEGTENPTMIVDEWQNYDFFALGESVTVHDHDATFSGQYHGLNNSFQPQVMIDGEIKSFMTGQVSIRKTV